MSTHQEPVCQSGGVPWTKHRGIEGTCAELQRLKITGERLAGLLVKHRIVDPCVVEDPEGYDHGRTLDAISCAAREIREGGVMDTTLEAVALSWLRYERRCFLVCLGRNPLPEMCIPDVLGMGPDRRLIEIEIKRTMADFRQNGKKRGIKYRTHWPKQFYFLVEPKIAERARCELKAGIFNEAYERAGLLTLNKGIENAYTGLPYLECLVPAPINKAAVKLSVHAVGRMIRHQSGTLARLAATNALIERNDGRTNDGDTEDNRRGPETGAEGN